MLMFSFSTMTTITQVARNASIDETRRDATVRLRFKIPSTIPRRSLSRFVRLRGFGIEACDSNFRLTITAVE